jgi:hypothetical protein
MVSLSRHHEPVCGAYGSTERVQLHHRDYSRLGRERNADVGWACDRCHQLAERLVLAGIAYALRGISEISTGIDKPSLRNSRCTPSARTDAHRS